MMIDDDVHDNEGESENERDRWPLQTPPHTRLPPGLDVDADADDHDD